MLTEPWDPGWVQCSRGVPVQRNGGGAWVSGCFRFQVQPEMASPPPPPENATWCLVECWAISGGAEMARHPGLLMWGVW